VIETILGPHHLVNVLGSERLRHQRHQVAYQPSEALAQKVDALAETETPSTAQPDAAYLFALILAVAYWCFVVEAAQRLTKAR
jgi:hypothetical protein